MSLHRPTVVILSSDPEFARAVTESWPAGAERPEFTLLEHDLGRELACDNYDLAIADAAPSPSKTAASEDSAANDRMPLLAAALAATRRPAMVIHSESYRDLGDDQKASLASVFFLHMNREQPFWAELVGIVGREILRRTQSESHARQLEQSLAAAEAEATLGRYMVEMRHSVNNALTSVLGNAELLALEPGLPATVQAQADTIRNMALRLNEIYRRFSSIEKELSVKARESSKPPQQARAAATGL